MCLCYKHIKAYALKFNVFIAHIIQANLKGLIAKENKSNANFHDCVY